jgi:hypothetical protein
MATNEYRLKSLSINAQSVSSLSLSARAPKTIRAVTPEKMKKFVEAPDVLVLESKYSE